MTCKSRGRKGSGPVVPETEPGHTSEISRDGLGDDG